MGAKILVVEPGGSFFYKFFGFNTPARHAEGTANPFIPWTEEQWYSSSAKKCKTTPHPPPDQSTSSYPIAQRRLDKKQHIINRCKKETAVHKIVLNNNIT
jgi:hypothetical protein